MDEHFNVYFIDLPGFIKNTAPLQKITIENYSKYVQNKISTFDLEKYLLGGISFGFLIANRIPIDKKCKGIVAITPYINSQTLKLPLLKKSFYSLVLKILVKLDKSEAFFESKAFYKLAHTYSVYPTERINIILDQMDGKTFFETGKIILEYKKICEFHDTPYALILSNDDKTINTDSMRNLFEEKVDQLHVIHTTIDHYPKDPSKEYFQENLPKESIMQAVQFFNKLDKKLD